MKENEELSAVIVSKSSPKKVLSPVRNPETSQKVSSAPPSVSPEQSFKASSSKRVSEKDTTLLAKTEAYGFGKWKPRWLQVCHNAKCLVACLSVCSMLHGTIVMGLGAVSLTTVEKRFDLSSTQSGFWISVYEIAIVIVQLPISHFGVKGSKPKWVAAGVFLLGIGSFVCSIPHFLVGSVLQVNQLKDTCLNDTNTTLHISHLKCHGETKEVEGESYAHLRGLFVILIIGRFLCGVGATPLYTLGITYLDENVPQALSPIYLGVFFGLTILGPSAGFLLGGALLRIHGDIDKGVKLNSNIEPENPLWYGAWWIGFLGAGLLAVICSIPVFGFARRLPGSGDIKKVENVQYQGAREDKDRTMSTSWRDVPKELFQLLKNYPYVCVVLMKTAESFLISAFINFLPKILESFFNYSSSFASLLAGVILIPGGLIGNIGGGLIVNRFKLKCRSMLIMALVCHIVSLFMVFTFLIVCPETRLVGINEASITNHYVAGNITDECNTFCDCSNYYNPVCHYASSINFYSPCHAGCHSVGAEVVINKIQLEQWTDCMCVNETAGDVASKSVMQGYCPVKCNLAIPFLILLGLHILISFVSDMPLKQVELRIVTFHQRTLSISFTRVVVLLFGGVPGPIVLGYAIDKSCVLWKKECGEEESCLRYDPWKMGISIVIIGVCFKVVICVFLILAYYFNRPTPDSEEKQENTSSPVSKQENEIQNEM